MKRINLFLITVLSLIALSCTKEETDNLVSTGNRVAVNASRELPADVTKSTINNGYFLWSVGDRIACYTSTGNFQYSDALEDDDFTDQSQQIARFWFSLTGSNPYLHSVAVFPVYPTVNSVSYAPSYDETGDDLTIKIPETMEWKDGEVNNIQIATFSSGSNINLSFFNVAGMIKFTLNNIPVGANQVLFKTGKRITGDFVIEGVNSKSQADTYITAGDASNDGITFTFDEVTTAGTSKVFYVPVPVGTYNSIGFRVQKNDGTNVTTLWKKTATVDNTVNRGVMKVMPALTFASATGGGEGDPATIITTLSGQTGTVNLPSTTDNVLVELNSTSGELTLAYSEEENAKKPAVVYVRVLADATVGTLNINLPNSTVYLNGKANSNLATLTSVTAESTLKVLESPLTISTATINQGNVEVAGTVNAIVVASGATSDGQAASDNNKIQISVSSAAAVQTITLNAKTDVVVEQPKDNIVAENTENKVYVVVNATGSTAKAQNGGNIYVTANADCKVTADGNNATVVLENNGATVTTKENNNGVITEGAVTKAQIGSNRYASIVEALGAAQDGNTITLIADNIVSDVLVNTKNITLDLGTYSISGSVPAYLFQNQGTLVINADAHNPGKIFNVSAAKGHGAVLNDTDCTITINGGIFGDNDTDHTNTGVVNGGCGFRNRGNATVNGGVFTTSEPVYSSDIYAYAIVSGESDTPAYITINGGHIYGRHGDLCNNNGTMVINNVTTHGTANYYSIYAWKTGTVTVKGGTYVKNSHTSGAKFQFYADEATANIVVKGGSFTKNTTGNFAGGGKGTVELQGGTYNMQPEAKIVAAGYAAAQTNSVWTVAPVTGAAAIGSTGYETLVDAINNVTAGQTITLLNDLDFSQEAYSSYKWADSVNPLAIRVNNVTLDLNGHTISNMGNCALGIGSIFAKDGTVSGVTIKNGTLNAGTTKNVVNSYVLLLGGAKNATIQNVTTNGGINACANSDVSIKDCHVNGTKYYTVCAQTGANVTISGTTYTKNTDQTVQTKAMFWVQGAGTDSDMKTNDNPDGAFAASVIDLQSGNYTLDSGGSFYLGGGLAPVVHGGTYNFDPSDYVPDGYKATSNGNGTWTVAVDNTVYAAKIGTKKYETIDAALAAVNDGETITLQENVDHNSANLVVALGSKNVTLDLNGKTLSGRTNLTSGKLTISNGTIQCTGGQALNVYGSDDSSAQEYSVLTVNNNVTVNGAYGVCLFGKTASTNGYGAVVNIKGNINANEGVFVSGNLGNKSTLDNSCNVINITGTINGGELGVAVNGSSTVNVKSGANITGGTAIPVKRGQLNVTGGTISATGEWNATPGTDNNGAEFTGAAVSVTSTYNYSGVIDVNISGGTFTSTYGEAVYKYENQAKPYNNASVSITGGTFSSNPSAYVAEGYKATGGNSTWTVTANN